MLTRHIILGENIHGRQWRPRTHNNAKAYAQFCRFRRLFLVDGLEPWRAALKARGLAEEEINAKLSAAADFIKSMEEPSSQLREA